MAQVKPDVVLKVELFNDSEVCVFYDYDKCNAFCRQNGVKEISFPKATINACAAMKEDDSGIPWFIAFIPADTPPETVCHECLHLAWAFLDKFGIKVKRNTEELLAYLQQYLARQFFQAVNQQRKRNDGKRYHRRRSNHKRL